MYNTQLLEYNCYIFDLVLSITRYNAFTSSLKQLVEFLIFFLSPKKKKKDTFFSFFLIIVNPRSKTTAKKKALISTTYPSICL